MAIRAATLRTLLLAGACFGVPLASEIFILQSFRITVDLPLASYLHVWYNMAQRCWREHVYQLATKNTHKLDTRRGKPEIWDSQPEGLIAKHRNTNSTCLGTGVGSRSSTHECRVLCA